MQTILKVTIPLREESGESISDSHLIIEARKDDLATIILTTVNQSGPPERARINRDDLRDAATDLWRFLKR